MLATGHYCCPNPAAPDAAVRPSRPVAGTLLDGLGRALRQLPAAPGQLTARGLPAGRYLLRATDGATSRQAAQCSLPYWPICQGLAALYPTFSTRAMRGFTRLTCRHLRCAKQTR